MTKKIILAFMLTGFILSGNQPNPWNEWTRVNFEIPRSGEVTIRIFDAQGKMLYYNNSHFEAGKQYIDLEDQQLTGRGVLISMLEFEGEQRVSRMILNE